MLIQITSKMVVKTFDFKHIYCIVSFRKRDERMFFQKLC